MPLTCPAKNIWRREREMNRGGREKQLGKELKEGGTSRFLAAARNDMAKGFFNKPIQTRPATLFKAAGQKRKGNTLSSKA